MSSYEKILPVKTVQGYARVEQHPSDYSGITSAKGFASSWLVYLLIGQNIFTSEILFTADVEF